jgi:hypothetical protein
MRSNGYTLAFHGYLEGLDRARQLHQIERRNYKDPPPAEHQTAVEALRGGAIVLMIASLERYLQEAFEEFVDVLSAHAKTTNHVMLPPALVEFNDLNFFEWLIRDSRVAKREKATEVKRVAQLVSGNLFVPEAFSRTRSNPGAETIRKLFPCLSV